ncbi:MAG: HAD-IIIC family phosphatase [Muribaculaceae bacterium]|nr:HAD-IIIC family phosphatase [Muribaculaceae bacterium]
MKYFIFRNQTVEPLWAGCDAAFSGYGDISCFDREAERLVWFYMVPPGVATQVADEVETYFEKLQLVGRQIPDERPLIVFTLVSTANTLIVQNDRKLLQAIDEFNHRVTDWASGKPNVKVVDFHDFTSRFDKGQLINWKFYFISQMVLNPKLAGEFGIWWRRKERELDLERKKCLVLDLDNTLWGGVLVEEGVTGILIGDDYPGKAFLYWQQALLTLSKSGVILTVCSKNNEADVLEAWNRNPFMVLKKEHFAAWRINWRDKATNIQELATELNIGLDSMVFVDDNPAERELIRQTMPMVEVPEFPKRPYELMSFYDHLVEHYFSIYTVTGEDLNKTEQYKQNAQRAAAQSTFTNIDDYLSSLGMKLTIMPLDEFNLPRAAQMTQKTNQFNLTTHRYSESDIRQLVAERCLVYCLSVSDRFGDSGITGEIILRPCGDKTMEIDTLLLSCRILGKGIEAAFVDTILNRLADNGITTIKATYIKTPKNALVADFYDRMGFTLIGKKDDTKQYILALGEKRTIKKDFYDVTIK